MDLGEFYDVALQTTIASQSTLSIVREQQIPWKLIRRAEWAVDACARFEAALREERQQFNNTVLLARLADQPIHVELPVIDFATYDAILVDLKDAFEAIHAHAVRAGAACITPGDNCVTSET